MGNKGIICFDMDGTIVDLYGYPRWLECLRKESPLPYLEAPPLVDMTRLNSICNALIAQGWEIRVISWLAKDSSPAYKKEVRQAKRIWLQCYGFPVNKAHFVAYGTTKATCVRNASEGPKILIDDNAKVRNGWHIGETIDASIDNWLDALEAIVGPQLKEGDN